MRLYLFVLVIFFISTQDLLSQVKDVRLNFLLGSFDTRVLLPDGKGGWQPEGKGRADFFPILDGTFIREELKLSFGNTTLTMSNSIGQDGRDNQLRLIAMDKEYSTMDVYYGKVETGKLIFTNLHSDIPAVDRDGNKISFKLTYSQVSPSENQSLVEITRDEGKSWTPFSMQKFLRVEGDTEKTISQTVLKYIEAYMANDFEEMSKYLHPSLSRRGINNDGKLSKNYSVEELKSVLAKKEVLNAKEQDNLVSDISISSNVATALLHTGLPGNRWKEYIHLAKLEGEWKIVDIFWTFL